MKIKLNEEVLCQITDFDKKVLSSYFSELDLENHVKNILTWNIKSLCEGYKESLKTTWLPILFKRYPSIPTGDEELINLILSQPDYKSKEQKEFEERAQSTTSCKEI